MSKNDDVKLNEGILLILVHNATNVPSMDRFRGLPDPYVNIFYLGSSTRKDKKKRIEFQIFCLLFSQELKNKRIGNDRLAIQLGTK